MRKKEKRGSYIVRYVIIICASLMTILPLYVTVVTSLTPADKVGGSFILPKYFEWENYVKLFQVVPMTDYIKASLIYAFGCSVGAVIIASISAYALSRFKFKGKNFFMTVLLAVQIIPQIIISIPLFKNSISLGLYDKFVTVIFVLIAAAIPYPVLLLKGFFDTISQNLEGAAMVDGCTQFQAFVRVILPLSKPAFMTAFSLSFFVGWDLYLYPMILTVSSDKIPLTLGLSRMIDFYTPWEILMAGTVIGIIPPVIVFLLGQRYLVGGLTAGSEK